MANQEKPKHLPGIVWELIGTFGYGATSLFWDMEEGQPGVLLRWIFRKQMEDRGEIPPSRQKPGSDE